MMKARLSFALEHLFAIKPEPEATKTEVVKSDSGL